MRPPISPANNPHETQVQPTPGPRPRPWSNTALSRYQSRFVVETYDMAHAVPNGFTATTTPGVLADNTDPDTLLTNEPGSYDLTPLSITITDSTIGLSGPSPVNPTPTESPTEEQPGETPHPDLEFFRTLAPLLDPDAEEMVVQTLQGSGSGGVTDDHVTYRINRFRVAKHPASGPPVEMTAEFDLAQLDPQWDDPDAFTVYHEGFMVDAVAPGGHDGFVFEWSACGYFDNQQGAYVSPADIPDGYEVADYVIGFESGRTYSVPVVDSDTRSTLQSEGYTGGARYELVFNLRACRDNHTNTRLATY